MTITGLSRAIEKDIDAVYNAVKYAKNNRIHTFLATSDIHLKHKLKWEASMLSKLIYKADCGFKISWSQNNRAFICLYQNAGQLSSMVF